MNKDNPSAEFVTKVEVEKLISQRLGEEIKQIKESVSDALEWRYQPIHRALVDLDAQVTELRKRITM